MRRFFGPSPALPASGGWGPHGPTYYKSVILNAQTVRLKAAEFGTLVIDQDLAPCSSAIAKCCRLPTHLSPGIAVECPAVPGSGSLTGLAVVVQSLLYGSHATHRTTAAAKY